MASATQHLASDRRPRSQIRRVAVLIEIDDTWGRNVVEAVSQYAYDADWQLLIAPRDAQRRLRMPPAWRGDGAIVLLRDQSLLEHVREAQLPAVNVSSMYLDQTWLGRVATDDAGRARMAFDHFASRKLGNFACYSPRIGRYSDERAEAFRRVVSDEGFACSSFPSADIAADFEQVNDRSTVANWLESLPRPVAIFAPDPYSARQLAEVCVWKRIDIPGDVAILSGDEDELLCELIRPPLSSIELASHRIGFEACRMLERIMRTGRVPQRPKLLQPLRVCSRRSTEGLAIDDGRLAAVVKFIWERAADGIQVQDLVSVAAMSRRTLEQRFRESLGRTPAEEIRRVRLEKARQMIVTTSLSISYIALACGFSSGPYLTHAFRQHYGITPSELRVGRKNPDHAPLTVTRKSDSSPAPVADTVLTFNERA